MTRKFPIHEHYKEEPEGPKKAYYIEESFKGVTTWIVYANTAKEARENFWEKGEAIDSQAHPQGVRSVRRAPTEDR